MQDTDYKDKTNLARIEYYFNSIYIQSYSDSIDLTVPALASL